LVAVLALAMNASAQPGFGPKNKPKPKPDAAPAPAADPNAPNPDAPPELGNMGRGATQTPSEWNDDDPPRKEPSVEAKPGDYFCWKTTDGLRYAWSLPVKFEASKAYDLIVMLHPDKMDFRWGPANHMRGEEGFAPDCMVVSVDGLGANAKRPEARSFDSTSENCVRFRDVLLEFSRQFPVRHIFLYGSGSGGKFAAYFSGAFPALADGVLAHETGIADNSAVKSTVPIVFMHGSKDSLLPMKTAFDAQKAYVAAGHKAVWVRILRGYNDFPNATCAADCINWLRAMRAEEPADAMDYVNKMLTVKETDEFGYHTIPWFAGANAALARFSDEKARKFETEPTPEQAKAAEALVAKIEAEGKANADNVRRLLKAEKFAPGEFVLDGGPWLGYMLATRDDFRGIKSVEAMATELKLDEAIAKHAEVAADLWQTWEVSGSDANKFDKATESIPKCFLYEGLPTDLLARCRACMKKADELELEPEARNLYEFITLWDQGWKDGLEAYELRWSRWGE
jgi:dienelactone hydrolase